MLAIGIAAIVFAPIAENVAGLRRISSEIIPLDSIDMIPPSAGTQYFSNDNNGLTIVRTPSQVLSIIFANATPGTTNGGFFANGVNGNMNTV